MLLTKTLVDAAAARAVAGARTELAGTRLDPGGSRFHLLVVPRLEPADLPAFNGADQRAYADAVRSLMRTHALGGYADDGVDDVLPDLGIALSHIAALKAATVCRLWQDLRFVVEDHRAGVGDTKWFGAVPVRWRDPDGDSHDLVVAGTGWPAAADRHAALGVARSLDLELAETGGWTPKIIDVGPVVLRDGPPYSLVAD